MRDDAPAAPGPTDEPPTDGPVEVRRAPTGAVGEEWSLVLAASAITHALVFLPDELTGSWSLRVAASDLGRAHAALAAYDRESAPAPEVALAAHGARWLGIATTLLLVAAFAVAGPAERGSRFIELGSADAARIIAGEPWRVFTALTLHGDWMHLASNCIAALLVVGAAGWWLGPGVASLALVIAGGTGNLLTAWAHRAHHDSVGASTAIFAAIGLLAALAAVARGRGVRIGPARTRRGGGWLFAGAALGLFAMLGAGPKVDVLAHVFGLLAGGVLGIPIALLSRRPARRPGQLLAGVLALALLAGAWALALDA